MTAREKRKFREAELKKPYISEKEIHEYYDRKIRHMNDEEDIVDANRNNR